MRRTEPIALVAKIILFAGLCSSAYGQNIQQFEDLDSLAQLRNQVQELDRIHGRHSPALIEPLVNLARAAFELNQFDETHVVLDRAVQIQRFEQGLKTRSQLPLLSLIAENYVKQGNWPEANAALDHLYYLNIETAEAVNTELVENLMHIANLHLEGIANDDVTQRNHHFLQALNITMVATRIAEPLWGINDIRLVDLYFNTLNQLHLQSVAIYAEGSSSYALRKLRLGTGSRGSYILSRQQAKERIFERGATLLSSMRRAFVTASPPNDEAAAMVDLYQADWLLLFGQKEAGDAYKNAFERLQQTTASPTILDDYFSHPVVIPMQKFYPTLAQAYNANQQSASNVVGSLESTESSAVHVSEWSPAFPSVRSPWGAEPVLSIDLEDRDTATMLFELEPLAKVSKWVNGRYVTNFSVARNVELISLSPGASIGTEELAARVHNVHLRPSLRDGVPQPYQGTLQFRYFAKND